MLNYVLSNSSTLASYINYAMKRGLKVLPPNVNVSTDRFVFEANRLFMPLNTIYSIGNIQEKYIIDERLKNGLFKSFDDFKNRCKNLSQAQIQALIYAGALDIFGKTKKSMIENSSNEDNIIFKHLVGVIKDDSEYDFNYLKDNEKKYLGFNLQYNIYININELINKYRTTPLNKLNLNTYSNVIASINNLRIIKTKTAEYMASFNLSDGNIDIHAVVFARYFKELKDKLKEDVLLNIRGKLELDYKKEYSFTVIDIKII
jgi:DNA polymerase-3 subunit alpha